MQCPVGRVRVPMNVLLPFKSSRAKKKKRGMGWEVMFLRYKVMQTLLFFDWD